MIVYIHSYWICISTQYQINSIFCSHSGNKFVPINKTLFWILNFLEGNLVSFISKKKYRV